jgi:hypothetical protein
VKKSADVWIAIATGELLDRVTAMFSDRVSVRTVSLNELGTVQQAVASPAVLLIGDAAGTGNGMAAALRQFRAAHVSTSVLLCLTRDGLAGLRLAHLCRSGVDQVFIVGVTDSVASLQGEIEQRLEHRLPTMVSDAHVWSDRSRGTFEEEWSLRNAFRSIHVFDLARHFAIDRKTLYADVRRIGWNDPKSVVDCARFVHVAAALDAGLTAEQISLYLSFSESSVVHRLIKRVSGEPSSVVRTQGALETGVLIWRARRLSTECASRQPTGKTAPQKGTNSSVHHGA